MELVHADFGKILKKTIIKLDSTDKVNFYAGLVYHGNDLDLAWEIFYEVGADYTGLYDTDLSNGNLVHTEEELDAIDNAIEKLMNMYDNQDEVYNDMEYFIDYVNKMKELLQEEDEECFTCDTCGASFKEEDVCDDRPSDFPAIRCSTCYEEGLEK